MKVAQCFFLILSSVLLSPLCKADIKAEFKGTLISAPCKINGDTQLDYDFKNVIIQMIKGASYQQTQSVEIKCSSVSNINVNITLNGTKMTGKDNVLQTNVTGLGIALLNGDDDTEIKIGKAIPLMLSAAGETKFNLKAVVVNPNNTKLANNSDFSATATLTTSYN